MEEVNGTSIYAGSAKQPTLKTEQVDAVLAGVPAMSLVTVQGSGGHLEPHVT